METDSITLFYFLKARRAYLSGRWYTYIFIKRPVSRHREVLGPVRESLQMKNKMVKSACRMVAAAVALSPALRRSFAFQMPAQPCFFSSPSLVVRDGGILKLDHGFSTALRSASLPPDGERAGLGSRRRQSRFNKEPKQPEEPKKDTKFSKDSHFYTGAIGIGTYSWGDRRDGFFYGDVSG